MDLIGDRGRRVSVDELNTTQLLAHDAKRVHLFHEMYEAEQGYLAATNETIVMNIDYASRRSAPWAGSGACARARLHWRSRSRTARRWSR